MKNKEWYVNEQDDGSYQVRQDWGATVREVMVYSGTKAECEAWVEKHTIKFVRTECGYEAQVNGVTKGYIWKTKGATKYYVSYPTQYFYHLKDAKLAVAERINNL